MTQATSLTAAQLSRLFAASDARHQISILIPSTSNGNIGGLKIRSEASVELRDRVITAIEKLFAKQYGGVSTRDSVGGWIDYDTGEIIRELGTTITSFVSDLTADNVRQLFTLAAQVRETFQQDAVLVTVDHAAWFVDAGFMPPTL